MKNGARTILLLCGDIAILILAFFCMLYISFYGRLTREIIHLHTTPFFILGILWIILFFLFNLYNTQATRLTIPHLRKIFITFIVALIVGIIFFYITPFFKIAPKTNLVIFGTVSFFLFIAWRRFFYTLFAAYFKKEVVFIVGERTNTTEVNDLKKYITENPQSGFTITGVFDSLDQFLATHPLNIPGVFIVSKEIWADPENFKKLQNINSEVLDLAYAYEDILSRIPIEAIDESWFIHNVHVEQNKNEDIPKRILGVVVATLVIIIASPILLIVALLIKLHDGRDIFYSQVRVGKNNKNFNLYKFRSMVVDAEKNGAQWSTKKDDRVTPVGKIIRKLHIDEIPQMWNIIKGDISLVGPRPERPEFVAQLEKEIPFYYLRHTIIPGFTGWAQIKFRYASTVLDSKEKFEYDLYYLKNRNIFMDLGIFARTIQIIFTH